AMKTSSDRVPTCPKKRRQRIRQTLVILAAVAAGALATAALLLLWPGRGNRGENHEEESEPPLAVIRAGQGTVGGVAFSPGDQMLATAIEDGTIKLWDMSTRNVKATLTGHRAGTWSIAYNRDGSRLVSAGDDNTARVWDLTGNRSV